MKTNKWIRLAAILCILCLLTTSVISGTFAKYVTSDTGSDTARVAKWGVKAVVSGSLFGADYAATTDDGISATYTGSVDSSGDATGVKIVAPGTKNDTGVTITISGTPEVRNTVAFSSADNKDIYLKAGNYASMVPVTGITADNFGEGVFYTLVGSTYTKAESFSGTATYYEAHDIVNVTADYYPVTWTVTGTGAGNYTKVADMVIALGAYSGTNDSLANIAKTSNITWAWAFSNNDGADTILGNIIAADASVVPVKTNDSGDTYTTLTNETDYYTTVTFNYTITITQVD